MKDNPESVMFDLSRDAAVAAPPDSAPKRRPRRVAAAVTAAMMASALAGYALVALRQNDASGAQKRADGPTEALEREVALLRKRVEALESGQLRAAILDALAAAPDPAAKNEAAERDSASGDKRGGETSAKKRGSQSGGLPSGADSRRERSSASATDEPPRPGASSAAPASLSASSRAEPPPDASAPADAAGKRPAEASPPARVACAPAGGRPLVNPEQLRLEWLPPAEVWGAAFEAGGLRLSASNAALVCPGERLPSGETLARVEPGKRLFVTDRRIVMLFE